MLFLLLSYREKTQNGTLCVVDIIYIVMLGVFLTFKHSDMHVR